MPRRPPKKWFYRVVEAIKKARPKVRDPYAVAGWLWYHGIKRPTRAAILRAEGTLDPEQRKAIEALKGEKLIVRRRLISEPEVLEFEDFEGIDSTIRILKRADGTNFPEFAFYPRASKWRFGEKFIDILVWSGFRREEPRKWVLRTNRFSIFVYL